MPADVNRLSIKSVAIILAAGSSSRFGQSKQLLKIGHETLLRNTIRVVLGSEVNQVVVILGARGQEHRKEFADMPVSAVYNPDWEKGMGSSLKCGVQFVLEKFPSSELILVAVCDQPSLTSDHLKKLMHTFQIKKCPIVASFYAGVPGVPVLFHRSMFDHLLALDDEFGARKIIKDHGEALCVVDFPAGEVDLDTPDDFEKFRSTQ